VKPNHDPHPEVTAMTLTITGTAITSDRSPRTARQAPGRPHQREGSWLPGQALDRNTAITAMLLAGIAGQGNLHEGHRLWPHIEGWAAELGLTGPDAIARASQPPRDLDPGPERPSGQPDRDGGRLTSQPDTTSRSPGDTGRTGRLPEDAIAAPEGTSEKGGYPGGFRDSPEIRPVAAPDPEAGL
jgi:hypothetical protein